MSISTLQEKFKGCFVAAGVVAAVAMGASMFTRYSSSSSQGPTGSGAGNSIATIGDVPVTADIVQAQASKLQTQAMQQQAEQTRVPVGSLGAPDAGIQAQALVRATGTVLQSAAVQALLAQSPVTDAELTALGAQVANAQIDQRRTALTTQGKLKPGASDADLEKAMKDELKGKTLAQIRDQASKAILAAYKDPISKAAVLDQYGGPLLVARYGEKAVGSDQALRDSYKSYVVRRVFLSATSGSKETPEARAEKVLADLKAGKSFEAEMDAVSNDPPPAGKKVSTTTESVPSAIFAQRPELSSLKGLAPNAMTPVVDVPGGKAIYQLVSTQDDLPKNFEADKAKLRAEKIRSEGVAAAEKAIKAILAGGSVRWRSPGYQALAATADATSMGFVMDQGALKKAISLGLVAAKSENPNDRRLGAEALLASTDPRTSMGIKSPENAANRLTALEAAKASEIQDAGLMLELAGLYGDKKDGAKATDALLAASKANSDYGTRGQRTFSDIAAKALELQKKGILTPAQLASVQTQQQVWTAARMGDEKAQGQAKMSEADQQKANDAEIARQKEEASGAAATPSNTAAQNANAAEIARQKAQSRGKSSTPSKGGSLLPTTAGAGK